MNQSVIGGRWRQRNMLYMHAMQQSANTQLQLKTHAMATKQNMEHIYTCHILWTSKCAYICNQIIYIYISSSSSRKPDVPTAETQAQFDSPQAKQHRKISVVTLQFHHGTTYKQ
jgi:hypothetical protein